RRAPGSRPESPSAAQNRPRDPSRRSVPCRFLRRADRVPIRTPPPAKSVMYRPEIERLSVARDVVLSAWNTLQLGGPARFFAAATDERTLLRLLQWAEREGLAVRLIGGGSNIVIADEGVDALVIHTALRGVTIQPTVDCVELTLAAGEPWDDAVARAVAAELSGIEALSGIPGLSGATPIQNVGAYGQEISQVFARARVLDRHSLEVTT